MESVSRGHDYELLKRELKSREYQNLLQELQRGNPFLRQFGTWGDAITFMRQGTSQDPRKDQILHPIFEAHGKDKDPQWRTILLAIFWPGLESIHYQKRGWDPDLDERWQTIVWTFLEVICRLDVRRRPCRLVQKVYNDTVHHIYDVYRRAWDRAGYEVTFGQEEPFRTLVGELEGVNFVALALREEKEAAIRRLREEVDSGRISEADYFLLVGTRVYGESVSDYASEVGLDYQVAKKRRQRAEAAIRRLEPKGI